MKRIHYLLLGLLVSLTIAAVSPTMPPTRIAPGSGVTVVTNGVNSFTISASGGGGATNGIQMQDGLGTNTTLYGLTINTGSTNNSLTASRAVVTDANKGVISSGATATEVGYLSGVAHAITNRVTSAGFLTTQQTAAYASGTNVTVAATNSLHFLTLTNTTYFPVPSGLTTGCSFTIIVQQDATGARAVTFDTNIWRWPSGTQPTITTNASAYDVISCISCPFGTNVFAVVNQYFR